MAHKLVKSHHVFGIQVQKQNNKMYNVFALCLQGKAPSAEPHRITIKIREGVRNLSESKRVNNIKGELWLHFQI